MGIEPGDTRTKSATRRLWVREIADVTSRFSTRKSGRCVESARPRFFQLDDRDEPLRGSSGTDMAATRPPVISRIVASMSSG